TTFSGNITGNGALATAGSTGNLVLSSANTYSGGTYLSAGSIFAGNAGAFGSAAVSFTANLLATGPLTFANPLLLNARAPVLTGANATSFSGLTTLLNSTTLVVNNAATLGGIIGESGGARVLTLGAGSVGTLTVSNADNFYSGGTTLNAAASGAPTGTLVVGSATALGTGALTLTAGTLQAGGAFAIASPVTLGTGGLV